MEIVSRTGRDAGQGGTVKEKRICWAGQDSGAGPEKGMALVPGGRGEGSAECDDERALIVPGTRDGVRDQSYLVLSGLIYYLQSVIYRSCLISIC